MARLRLWVALLTTSIVALISLVSVLDDRDNVEEDSVEWTRSDKWALSVASISLAFSFFGIVFSVISKQKAGRLELLMIVFVLGFWAAGLPAIVNPDTNLAVTSNYAIANANLFFFSYASIICSIFLLGSWYEDMKGEEASPTAPQWLLLMAFSITAMSSSIAYYQKNDCRGVDTTFCNRTRYSLYLGMVTAAVSFICVVLKKLAPLAVQTLAAFLLIVCYACAVAYVTFGSGPGTSLGSLYFATWGAFFLTINLTVTAGKRLVEERNIRLTMDESPAVEEPATATAEKGNEEAKKGNEEA